MALLTHLGLDEKTRAALREVLLNPVGQPVRVTHRPVQFIRFQKATPTNTRRTATITTRMG